MIWVYVRGDVDDDDVYSYGDVKFPSIECVPFTHTFMATSTVKRGPKLGLAKTSGIPGTILRTEI